MSGIDKLTGNRTVPMIRKFCRAVGRNLAVNSQSSCDIAEIGGKVIIYSKNIEGDGSLMMDVVKDNSCASTLLKRGNIAEQKKYLQSGSTEVVRRIRHLNTLIGRAEVDESKALTGF